MQEAPEPAAHSTTEALVPTGSTDTRSLPGTNGDAIIVLQDVERANVAMSPPMAMSPLAISACRSVRPSGFGYRRSVVDYVDLAIALTALNRETV